MLQPVQYAAPGASPARAPITAETVTAVKGADEGDRARNDMPRDRGTEAGKLAREARERAADPSRPAGPPPAFEANVLEVERARIRAEGTLALAGKTSGPGEPEAGAPPGAETRDTASPPAYGEVAEEPPRRLDLSR